MGGLPKAGKLLLQMSEPSTELSADIKPVTGLLTKTYFSVAMIPEPFPPTDESETHTILGIPEEQRSRACSVPPCCRR
jgi:hypothetical protein